MPSSRPISAFSLVELSIVLVILGLLVGGILTGQSLIRASELRSVTTEREQFYTAIKSFREKYMALPGDMSNATAFWGTNVTCPALSYSGPATCNGNGDEMVLMNNQNLDGDGHVTYDEDEMQLFWHHLVNARLVSGSPASAAYGSAIWMPGKMANSGWYAISYNIGEGITLNLSYTNANQDIGMLRPEEIWNIDTKIDDGKPGTGKMRLGDYNPITQDPSLCTDSTTLDANSVYRLTNRQVVCNALFTNM